MALKSGTPTGLSGSMAEAIQDAFNKHYPELMGKPAPGKNKQMTLLCVAIAEGVIKHLKANPEAFDVNVKLHGGVSYPATVKII